MGRLPDSWAGQLITKRDPYSMYGEIVLTTGASGSFPEANFNHNVDQPFEIHRLIPRVVGLSGALVTSGVVATQPDQLLLMSLIKINIERIGGTIKLTKLATPIANLVKGSSELTWEFADPDTVVRQEGYSLAAAAKAIPVFSDPVTGLLVQIEFQGYLLQIRPPSEQR